MCFGCSGSQEGSRGGGSGRGSSGGEVEWKELRHGRASERDGDAGRKKQEGVGRASQCDKTPALEILSG